MSDNTASETNRIEAHQTVSFDRKYLEKNVRFYWVSFASSIIAHWAGLSSFPSIGFTVYTPNIFISHQDLPFPRPFPP